MTPSKGRGGRRPGAGAPKGNKNRLRHGRYTQDDALREAMRTLAPPARQLLLPYIREGARSIKARRAWIDPALRHSDPKILPFLDPSITSTTQTVQSNEENAAALGHLALRLAAHGFIGATAFVRSHSPAAPVIEMVADHLDSLDDKAYAGLTNPGGLIRNAVHEEIAVYEGPTPYCPYCRWTGSQRKEQTS